MYELKWKIKLTDGKSFSGTEKVEGGPVRVVCDLPVGEIQSVRATMRYDLDPEDRIFVNGFQSWTNCPERGPQDSIRSLRHLPQVGVRKFGLERYGDYYFENYPEKPGYFHGESWAYARRGEEYRLLASLDETNGYTLIRYDCGTGKLRLKRDCRGLRSGEGFHAFDLYFQKGTEQEVFDGWFAAMGVKPRTTEPLCGYSSWYNRYQKIDEDCILSDLEACGEFLQPGDLFQIDDGWEPKVGDWLRADSIKFPWGMAPLVKRIHQMGLKAGLWLAPFVCQKGSNIYVNHPDWLLQVEKEPWYCGANWGGFYSLDIDNPEVQEYLRRVFRRVQEDWDFDLVKLDFLYGAAPMGYYTETRAGRMIRAMDFLRELCGDKLILGCGVPLLPAFGRVDYCRIGCDVGLDWDGNWLMRRIHRERVSTRQSLENTVFRRQLNGRAFLNDPDVFFLRSENLSLDPEQKRTLAEVNTLLGGVWLTSDDMGSYDEQQAADYRALRHLREAEDIRVTVGDRIRIDYRLDGEPRYLTADLAPVKKRRKR